MNYRPKTCPACDAIIKDTFTWVGKDRLRVNSWCIGCGWENQFIMAPEATNE